VPDQVGRRTTRPTEGLGAGGGAARRARALLRGGPVTHLLHADKLWSQGFSGAGVKVGRPEPPAARPPEPLPGRRAGAAGPAGPGQGWGRSPQPRRPSRAPPPPPQHAARRSQPALRPAHPAPSPPHPRRRRWACLTLACATTTLISGASRTAATGRTRTRCQTGWATAPLWRA
jgi:hypothetical protein